MSASYPAIALSSASTQEPCTLAEAKLWIKATSSTEDDDIITSLITVARKRIEQRTTRSLFKQSFIQYMDDCPAGDEPIHLGRSPLVSVASFVSYDDDNTATTLTSTDYIVDVAREPGRVVLTNGADGWPTDLRPANAVQITFTAGYSTSPGNLPEPLVTAVKAYTAYLYEHRGDEAGVGDTDFPPVVSLLIEDYLLPEYG